MLVTDASVLVPSGDLLLMESQAPRPLWAGRRDGGLNRAATSSGDRTRFLCPDERGRSTRDLLSQTASATSHGAMEREPGWITAWMIGLAFPATVRLPEGDTGCAPIGAFDLS